MIAIEARNFRLAYIAVKEALKDRSKLVDSGTWQSISTKDHPEMMTFEVEDVVLSFPVYTEGLDYHRAQIGPNLPWADLHFEHDRVSGQPLNPGVTWRDWPWGNKANSFRDPKGQFNHTYAERYWPKFAGWNANGESGRGGFEGIVSEDDRRFLAETRGDEGNIFPTRGIRYENGDLNDVVGLLVNNPGTRAAYLPVWFPEDTGIIHGGRTPCSLGYLFRMREKRLSVSYDIRSCDFLRHFQDDVYLTVRLLLWVLDRCRERDDRWKVIAPGEFVMHIGSLHIFKNDWRTIFPGSHI